MTYTRDEAGLPLAGLRVLDCTHALGPPYAGGLLGDMGAQVIKVEGPSHPDESRTGGLAGSFPDNVVEEDWWNRSSIYNLLNRGKLSLTLDLADPRGRDLFRSLVRISDVVVENYTPRVMGAWGLDYQRLRREKPDLIMVSCTGYGTGQGPYLPYPAQATTLEATHGLSWITGYAGGPPFRGGVPSVDFLAAWALLFALGAALRHLRRTGKGRWIDLGMYQLGALGVSEHIMDYLANGRLGDRVGNRHPYRAPQGCYSARGADQWVVLSVGSQYQWQALCRLMGVPDLAQDSRFAGPGDRMRNHDALDSIIGGWTVVRDKHSLAELLQGQGIPAGPVLDAREIHLDPHLRARSFLEHVALPQERGIGSRPLTGRPFKLPGAPVGIQGPAPAMGQHNRWALEDLLGAGPEQVLALERDGVVAAVPWEGEPVFPEPLEEQVREGRLAGWDPDYRDALGLP